MTILQVIEGRERDLGGFVVRRVLPHPMPSNDGRQMVGPFIFFDHLGPAQFAPGAGIDVRPHPHIALATVTYLFSGSLRHRDSLGSVLDIEPGDVNWMTAGSGITHSERTPPEARASGSPVHGIQSWVAMPDGCEDLEPAFHHHAARELPRRDADGVRLAVIAGRAYGLESPVATLWQTLYVDARLQDAAALEVPAEHEERALYTAVGEIEMEGVRLREGQIAVLAPGGEPRMRALRDSRVMLLGGARFPTPRHIWWNFVASTPQRIEQAKQRWQRQQFPAVPGETEFIPLPTP
jgi:redox-sensitive bicupin YhaK (pirin superfamily)